MSLHHIRSPHDGIEDGREVHDERVFGHQDGRCHAQHAAGIRADGPTTMPCDACEPCRLIRDALDGGDDPPAAVEVVASLIWEVEDLHAWRVRLEGDLAWERRLAQDRGRRVEALEAELETLAERAARAERDARDWRALAGEAQEAMG